ncbi:hypothetical protein C353_03886 [Cryptococcus neoformans AD1-83a]|nr:hypothetical protein C353_03886 [Cryptococcus neoformans var. grubii AD1-83a]
MSHHFEHPHTALWEFFAWTGPGHATGSAWTWRGVGGGVHLTVRIGETISNFDLVY